MPRVRSGLCYGRMKGASCPPYSLPGIGVSCRLTKGLPGLCRNDVGTCWSHGVSAQDSCFQVPAMAVATILSTTSDKAGR